jgi:hypothetical protein
MRAAKAVEQGFSQLQSCALELADYHNQDLYRFGLGSSFSLRNEKPRYWLGWSCATRPALSVVRPSCHLSLGNNIANDPIISGSCITVFGFGAPFLADG